MLQKAKSTKNRVNAKPVRKRSSSLEALEERIAPAVGVSTAVSGGTLTVTISASGSTAEISTGIVGSSISVTVGSSGTPSGSGSGPFSSISTIDLVYSGVSNETATFNQTLAQFTGAFSVQGTSGLTGESLTDTSYALGNGSSIDYSLFHGGGSLTITGKDGVSATKTSSFGLSSTLLTSATDGMSLNLSGVGSANLTDTTAAGGSTFTIGQTWLGLATLTGPVAGGGVTLDAVTVTKAGGFNLSNGTLTDTVGGSGDGMSLTLFNIGTANLTDNSVAGGNTFTVGGWTGLGMLTNGGLAGDTLLSTKTTGYTIVSPITGMSPQTGSISSGDNMSLTLSGAFSTANLTDSSLAPTANAFNVNGWTGGGTLTGPSTDTVFALKAGGFTLAAGPGVTYLTDSADAMNLTLSGIGLVHLTDAGGTSGGHSFDVSGWQGGGVLTNSESTPDILVASKTASFTLTNGEVISSDNMNLSLIGTGGFGTANLTDTGGAHSFTVSGWTGGGTLSNNGTGADTIVASKTTVDGSFTLSNNLLATSDGMSLSLAGSGGFGTADLTDASVAGGDTFTVSGWTGGGTLTANGTGADTIVASKTTATGSFTLSNNLLATSDGMSLSLAGTGGFGTADLTDASVAGGDTFTVSGWTGSGTLTANGTGADTIVASKTTVDGSFTLANNLLATSDGMSLGLAGTGGFGTADLTDASAAGGDTFTVSGWTGRGTLTANGTGADTIVASKTTATGSFTLANNLLATTDGMSLSLAGTGGFGTADLTDASAAGGDTFTVSGWTGTGTLTANGTGADTIVASKTTATGSFTLANNLLATTDGMSLSLAGTGGFGTADLTDASAAGGDTFTVSGWTGRGTLTANGTGADTIVASKTTATGSFTLANNLLATSDGMSLGLAGTGGFGTADLTDASAAGGDTFTVSGWTGTGTLTANGTGADTIVASKTTATGSFTLANNLLATTDGMSLGLAGTGGFGTADLTDASAAGGDTFTVSGWTGRGTLTANGTGADTIVASKTTATGSFTLANNLLATSDGMSLSLAGTGGFGTADLTDASAAGGDTFTVSGWTGRGTLTANGTGADTIVASKTTATGSFTLANNLLATSDGMSLSLAGTGGFGTADLTDASAAGGDTFTVSGWTGTGMLTANGTGADTIVASKTTATGSFTLANNLLATSDGMSLSLAGTGGFGTADLTDASAAGGDTFTVSGWTGTGTLTANGTGADTIVASKTTATGSFTLANNLLAASDGMSLSLAGSGGFATANLTDASVAGGDTFTVSGWTGDGTMTASGTGGDTIAASKTTANGKFTLMNNSLVTSDGMSLTLAGVSGFATANLTDASMAGGDTFTVSGWSGTGTLAGNGTAADTVVATKTGGFTLTSSGTANLTDSADRMSLTLGSKVTIATLTDSSASGAHNSFTVSGWTGTGTLTGLVTDTVVASKGGGFGLGSTLTDTADSMSLGLSGIGVANLTDDSIAGGNTFTITAWTGTGALLNGGAGADTISVSKSASYTLTNSAVSSSDEMSLTLSAATAPVSVGLAGTGGFTTANLTDTGGSNSFTVSGWTHKGSLTGAAGDSVIASKNVNKFILTDNSLAATDGLALVLSDVTTALLSVSNPTFGPTIFDATGYSGTLTATGGSPIPKTAGLAPLGNIFYGGSGHNTLIGGTDQDRYILQGLATESDTLEEPTTDKFITFNGYYEIGNSIDFSHMTMPTETVSGVKIGVNVNLNDISTSGVTQVFDPALTIASPTPGEAGTLTLIGNPGSFDELAGSPFKDTLIGNDAASPEFTGNTAAIKTLSKLVTLIYSGGDTTAEDTIQTGHGGAYVIYGKHLPFTTQTDPVPGVVFQLPNTVPYFATEPSLTPPTTVTATEPGKYTDNFDNLISITLSGPGSVAVSYNSNSPSGDPESLTLTGTTAASVLTIKILGVEGDITIGSITDNSSGLKSIDLGPGVSLGDGTNPALTVAGALGSLTVGGLNQASNLTAASFGNITSTGPIVGSNITATGKIGNITVKLTGATGSETGIAGSEFSAASIGNINVSVAGAPGDLTSGVAINGSTFTTTAGNIGTITGSVTDVTGSTGPAVTFTGSSATVFLDSAFTSAGNIAGLSATATGVGKSTGVLNLTGVVASSFTAAGNIGAVHISETATGKGVDATITGLDGVSNDPVLIQAGGSIASVSVVGSVVDTNIFAGANLGSTSVKTPTTNAGLSTISIGAITISGSLTSSTAGAFAIAATGNIGTVTVDGMMSDYAIAAGLDGVTDTANDNGRIAAVIVKGQYTNSSIVAGVESDTDSSSTTPYTWGSFSDNLGTSLAGVTQTSRIGAITLGAATVPSTVTTSVEPGATIAHDSAIEAMALVSIKVGKLKADTSFAAAGYIDELGGAEAAMDTLVRAGSLS